MMSDFFSVRAIDSHVHIQTWQDLDYMLDYRRRFDFDSVNIACISRYPKDPTSNILGAILKLEDPHFYAHAGLVYPAFPVKTPLDPAYDFAAQADLYDAIGFDGMKMLETKPTYQKETQLPVDDTAYTPYFDRLEKEGTHITWHSCDPEEFWDRNRVPAFALENGWFYGDGTYVTNDALYKQVDTVLTRHPKLHATFAHFFFLSDFPDKAATFLDTYQNVTLDITPGREMYGNFTKHYDTYRAFFRKYADRIIFGSDMESTESQGAAPDLLRTVYRFLTTEDRFSYWDLDIRGIGLSLDDAAQIMRGNFLRECPAPRSVNRAVLRDYIARNLEFVQDSQTRAHIQTYMYNKL
jgi:hypothetical protein